jgi:hypothetical protein
MSPFCLLFGCFLAAIPSAMGNSANGQSSQSSGAAAQELIRQSSFIFAGTVKGLKSSTVPIVSPTDGTATVHVDEVVYNAGVVSDVLGSDITVQLRSPGSVKEGEHAVFFSNVATYGESIVVDEVGHFEFTKEELESLRGQIKEAQTRMPEEQVQKRIAQADLIVTGTVTAVHPTAETRQRPPASEHDPQWWEATIKVQSVEKGPAQKGDVVLLFPHSDDVRWFGSPKFKEGQQGVFLLHRTEEAALRVRGFTALDALDFQPIQQRDSIKKLIRAAHSH